MRAPPFLCAAVGLAFGLTAVTQCADGKPDRGELQKRAAKPAVIRHVKVYAVPGRFGGWPANHGLWAWGDEILVGVSAGHFKDNGPGRHAIDHHKPEEHLLARSRDGGKTWSIEDPAAQGALIPTGAALHGV